MANVSVRRSGNFLMLDASGLRGFAEGLRRASPEMAKQLRTKMRRAGERVRDDAKVIASASDVPSGIAPSIRVRASLAGAGSGVHLSVLAGPKNDGDTAGGVGAAAAVEHRGEPGTFRHPLFGNRDYWFEQRAHPYLRPAAERNMARVADEVLAATQEVLDDVLGRSEV